MRFTKDRQAPVSHPVQRIPVVSFLLHCATLPVIVYLRRGFGYSFFSPRSLFFSISAAALVTFDEKRSTERLWNEFWALWLFGVGFAALYTLHFGIAVLRHFHGNAEHDFSSGRSWLWSLVQFAHRNPTVRLHTVWTIWVEPTVIFMAGFALRISTREEWLSALLMGTAPLLCFKEAVNYWQMVRQRKKHADAIEDSLELMDGPLEDERFSPPLRSARTAKMSRTRHHEMSAEDELRLSRYTKLLEVTPPFVLTAAEQNYRRIAEDLKREKLSDDKHNAKLRELSDAIAFIRQHLAEQKNEDPASGA